MLLLLDSPNWKIIHPRLFPQQKPQVFTCGFVAERQVLETTVKYIIIMMWYFTLDTLIYCMLSPLLRQ